MRARNVNVLLALSVVLCAAPAPAADQEDEPKLLGRVAQRQLEEEPYAEWFQKGYAGYTPNPEILDLLRRANRSGVGITVFFGTWCPDSQREVPRLLKVLADLGFPQEDLMLVAVDHVDEAKKQSPGGEEKGVEVYRVPTIVVSRNGGEVARIVEHPVLSLERDLLTILSGEPYQPAHVVYATLRRWLPQGLLADGNVSARGLAGQVRHEIEGEGDLASAAAVLLSRGQITEAVTLRRMNSELFPHSAGAYAALATALHRLGEEEKARKAAEHALRLDPDPDQVKEMVELLAGLPAPE